MKKLIFILIFVVVSFGVFVAVGDNDNFLIQRKEVKILFVGDMNFDRYIRSVMEKKGDDYVFSCVEDLLKSVDFVVGNLEGPITDNPSISQGSEIGSPENFHFTFPVKTASILLLNNFGAVNIGNNHIGNEGLGGISSTKKFLSAAGVGYFGGLSGDEAIYRMDKNGQKISFVGFNQFGGSSPEKVAEIIKSEREAGREVFVYAHWGEEYSEDVSNLRPIAESFVKAGASLIVASHPHIILPNEKIGDILVYYSLGNFIFDQYWNDEVRKGEVLNVTISNGKISTEDRAIFLEKDGRTCPVLL